MSMLLLVFCCCCCGGGGVPRFHIFILWLDRFRPWRRRSWRWFAVRSMWSWRSRTGRSTSSRKRRSRRPGPTSASFAMSSPSSRQSMSTTKRSTLVKCRTSSCTTTSRYLRLSTRKVFSLNQPWFRRFLWTLCLLLLFCLCVVRESFLIKHQQIDKLCFLTSWSVFLMFYIFNSVWQN